ncbi:MAG: efflux RND transporter periplasmic adaptor subunit, partial [Saprospiraceae bacterium]
GKLALLAEKTAEMKSLENSINLLKKEIEEMSPDSEKESVAVTIDTLKKQKFIRYIDLQGVVTSEDLVNAASDIGGRILQLSVVEGQRVQKGQLIARTDVEAIRTQKDELKKALDLAVDVFERQKRLWDQNIGSEIQFLQSKNNKERLEKNMLTMDAELRKSNVYAPISGVVDVVFLKQGEVAGPGVPIVQILNTSKVKVVSDVPETYLGKVKVGNKVDVHFPTLDKHINKPVSMLGRIIDASNRTFKMEIKMDNPTGDLKPNLLSVIRISDYVLNDAIVVPLELIQQEVSGQKYVYIAENLDGKWVVKKAKITTGESTEGNTVVSSGLKPGDKIISKGARSLTENQMISIETVK